jgi:hypothetical protein
LIWFNSDFELMGEKAWKTTSTELSLQS